MNKPAIQSIADPTPPATIAKWEADAQKFAKTFVRIVRDRAKDGYEPSVRALLSILSRSNARQLRATVFWLTYSLSDDNAEMRRALKAVLPFERGRVTAGKTTAKINRLKAEPRHDAWIKTAKYFITQGESRRDLSRIIADKYGVSTKAVRTVLQDAGVIKRTQRLTKGKSA